MSDADRASSERALVIEQRAFYEADAVSYHRWLASLEAPDNAEPVARDFRDGRAQVARWIASLAPLGRTLDVAGGAGILSQLVAPYADELVLLDTSPTSLALARRCGATEFAEGDIFEWEPGGRRFDTVCFSSWLHHIPQSYFAPFWETIDRLLARNGRVLFDFPVVARGIDPAHLSAAPTEAYNHYRATDGVSIRDHEGRRWRIVHVMWAPEELAGALADLGWTMRLAGPGWWAEFRWAIATRA